MKRLVVILTLFFTTSFFANAQSEEPNVSLYPVPVKTNTLFVKMKTATAAKAAKVELRNFIGRRLQIANGEGKLEISFTDMTQYPEGVYVILVKDRNGKIIESVKFVIAKQ